MAEESYTFQIVMAMTAQFVMAEEAPKGGLSAVFKTNKAKKERVRAHRRYERYYSKFLERGIHSATVTALTMAVRKANAVINEYFSAGKPEAARDVTSAAQLRIYGAADWLRRYVYDRGDEGRWFEEVEINDAKELAKKLDESAEEIGTLLLSLGKGNTKLKRQLSDPKGNVVVKQLSNRKVDDDEHVDDVRHPLVRRVSDKIEIIKRNIDGLKKMLHEAEAVLDDNDTTTLAPLYEQTNALLAAVKMPTIPHRDARLQAVPAWRNQGLKSLGPFGIQPCELNGDAEVFIETNIKEVFSKHPPGASEINAKRVDPSCQPWYKIAPTHKVLRLRYGAQSGRLSPFGMVSIPKGDDTFRLIRIPVNAKYFAWAYPILDSVDAVNAKVKQLHDEKIDHLSAIDYFCLFGGYVYFDKHMNFIRANGLHMGSIQLQFSSPYKLSKQIHDELVDSKRFLPVTLEFLEGKPKTFAWILPNEFTDAKYGKDALPALHPGAFAYEYENPEANNLFVLAATDTILAKKKAASADDDL